MPDFSLVPVEHQPDFSSVWLIPVDHDPFGADGAIQQAGTQPESQSQQAPTYNDPEGDAAAMSPETYVNPFVKRTLGNLATLPQRAIEAAKISAAHSYGPSPDVMSDSDAPFVDPLPSLAAETALTMMGSSGLVPVATGMIPAAKGVAGSVAEGAELTRIMGHKNPDRFFNDPSAINPQTGQLLHPTPVRSPGGVTFEKQGTKQKVRKSDMI